MNNLSIRFLALWVCCLCSALGLRGQTITAGTSPVCKNSSGSYTVAGGPVGTVSYQWQPPAGGALTSPNNGTTVSVLWSVAGSTSVSVNALGAGGVFLGSTSYSVTVSPLPLPVITSNVQIGCQVWTPPNGHQNPEGSLPPGDPAILDDGQGCVKVCEKSSVTYTATGSAGTTYTWNVTGGTFPPTTGNSITVSWGVAGPGNVTVTATTPGGCAGTKGVCIEKIQKPVAKFFEVSNPGATTITTCLNNTLYFQDASTGSAASPIVEWLWDFGDGTFLTSLTSTTESHAYTNPGSYGVRLTVKNACGCTDVYSIRVNVKPNQGVKIVCPAVVCDGTQADYSISPAGSCGSYQWGVSGGTLQTPPNNPGASVLWNSVGPSGFGYVTFNSSGCGQACPSLTTVKVPVIQLVGTIAGPAIACPNSQVLYNLPQWPSTVFNWTVIPGSTFADTVHTDQNNQIAINTHGPGVFTLRCNYTNTLLNCSGTASIDIRVLPPDSIIGPKLACLGSGLATPIHLASNGPGNWVLTQPDGSTIPFSGAAAISPTFPMVGTYSLSVTGAFCPPAPLVIRVNPLPPAPDSLTGRAEACFGESVDYKAGGPLPGTLFDWSVTSGSSTVSVSSDTKTAHAVFNAPAPTTISVYRITNDEAHCRSLPLTRTIVQPTPSGAIVGVDTVCPSTAYPFSHPYTLGDDYTWTMKTPAVGSVAGAGNTPAVEILFNQAPGLDTVVLEIKRCGTSYRFTKAVYVRPAANPVITLSAPSPLCRGQVFTAYSSVPGMATWVWGDVPGALPNPNPNYAYNGLAGGNLSYTISVSIANPYGCPGVATATLPVTVLPAPVVQLSPIGPIPICSGSPSQVLTPTLQNGYEPTNTLTWYNQNTPGSPIPGTGCTVPAPPGSLPPGCMYTVTALGGYYVVATGINGCKATSNTVVFSTNGCDTVQPCNLIPDGTVNLSGTVACGHVTLAGSFSSPSPTTAIAWNWSSTGSPFSVVTTNTSYDADFRTAGEYTIVYAVTFTNGTDTCVRRKTAHIIVPLVPDMGFTAVCNGSNNGYDVKLQDHSNYYPPYAPTKFSFYVDGVYKATVLAPANSYTQYSLPAGLHNFKTVTYYGPNDSCSSTASFLVPATPVASFTADSVVTCVKDQAVKFTNGSSGLGLTYQWTLESGIYNTATDPYRLYSSVGFNMVTLVATDKFGCTNAMTVGVQVKANDIDGAKISANPNPVCTGEAVTLQYGLVGATAFPYSYNWMRETDSLYTTNSSSTTVYAPGSYWVKGRNQIGCRVQTKKVNVDVNEVPVPFIVGDSSVCLNQPFTLYGYAGPGLTYRWLKGGATVGTNESYTETPTNVGSFSYRLIIGKTQFGITCYDTSAVFTNTVYPPPAPPYITLNIPNCSPYTVDLLASGSGTSFNWSNGQSGPHITTSGGGAFRVWMTDANGCKSHGDIDVPKDPRAYLWIFPTGCYEFCDNSLPRTIVGPIEPFNFWDWLQNGTPVLSHTGSPAIATNVQNYNLNSAGFYNLNIGTLACPQVMSDTMFVTTKPCGSGNGCGTDIIFKYQEFYFKQPCNAYWQFVFNSSLPYSVNVSLTASTGILSASSYTVTPGTNILNVSYNPPAGWAGGTVTFTMTYTDPKTKVQYVCTVNIYIPPCKKGPSPRPGDGARMANGGSGTAGTGLWLVPNPATNATRAEYTLNAGTRAGSVEVFDVTGRLMSSTVIDGKEASGSVSIMLSDYVPGVYLVVLREEGRVTQQSRLTVMH